MNTRYMEFFLKTVELGSINAASQELYISPQGLSQALQQLEKELGETLFYRQGNKRHLTAAGEAAYEAFRKIVQINNELTDQISLVRDEVKKKQNRINVIAAPIIAMTCLSKIITLFRQRNPDALINIFELPPEEFFEMEDFGVDCIGLMAVPSTMWDIFMRAVPEEVEVSYPYQCWQEVCLSVRSPLADRKSLTVRDLEKGRLILFGGDIRMLRHMPEGFDESAVAVQSRNIILCRSLIAAEKRTVGFTNKFVEYYMKSSGLTSVPFEPKVRIDYGYVINRNTENPLVLELRNLMLNEMDAIRKVSGE